MVGQPQGDPASLPPALTFTLWPALPHGLNRHQSETNPIKRFPELGVSSMIHSHSFSLPLNSSCQIADHSWRKNKGGGISGKPPLLPHKMQDPALRLPKAWWYMPFGSCGHVCPPSGRTLRRHLVATFWLPHGGWENAVFWFLAAADIIDCWPPAAVLWEPARTGT